MLKKLKYIFFGWIITSLVLVIAIGFSLKARDLFDLEPINVEFEARLDAEYLTEIELLAEGIAVQLVGSVETDEIVVQLYGDNYGGQKAYVYTDGTDAKIRFSNEPPLPSYIGYSDVEPLGMRIIVPKKLYEKIDIDSKWMNLQLLNIESKDLDVKLDYGELVIEESRIQSAKLMLGQAELDLRDSKINLNQVNVEKGSVHTNQLKSKFFNCSVGKGEIVLEQKILRGVYDVCTAVGDIYVINKKNPYNLIAHLGTEQGVIENRYSGKWKDALITQGDSGESGWLELTVGEGDAILKGSTKNGDIYLWREKDLNK